MKRFASHYLCLPEVGFIRQQVVEIDERGRVQHIFPLNKEVESVEWMPGVIVLLPKRLFDGMENVKEIGKSVLRFQEKFSHLPDNAFPDLKEEWHACLIYPFDFISMQPVAETRHRLLR